MESTDPPPATTAPPPSTAPDPAPPPTPAPITEESVVPTPPLQQPQAPQPGPPPAPSPQQQPPPSNPSSAPSQHPLNPPSQPQLQSQSQLQSQFQTPPQPPQTLAPPLAPAAQAQSQVQQPQQGPPQPARSLRPTPPSFSSHFPPHVPPPAATAAGPSSLLPSVSPSLPPSSGPLQRGGMAIGVPATLHHPRAQQQSPVPFSSLGPSPTFGQTFNGLPRSSVGMTSMAASASTQVRQPVQAIQNVGVVGAYTAASIRPGGVPGNHQQRPGQSTLRSLSPSPSNNQSPTGQKFQSHGLIRGPSVSSPGSPSPGPSQSSQPLQQPWMSGPGRPTNAPSLPTPSYRPQNKPQGLQLRPHQPQQQQQSMPTSQQQQKLLQHSQQQQPQKQLQQLHQQHQQQQPPLQLQQQQQQVSLPIQSLPKVQQSVHQQQQLSRSASQKTLVPATLQQGATQPGPPSPVAGTDVGESGNRILSKRSIHELVTQIDPAEKLDPEVEDILVEIAEDFVESITTFACSLAKHRKSTTLEAKDILLHLERNWNMTIPGFGGDEIKCYKKPFTNDIHKERLSLIKKSMISADAGNAKNSAAGQTAMNPKNHAPRASLIGSPKVT